MAETRTTAIYSEDDTAHALPAWFRWLQRHLLTSFLIIGEAYLLGYLMVSGWVPNIEDPNGWGIFHGIGVAAFFAVGAMAAGISLQSSLVLVASIRQRHWGMLFFSLIGVFSFSIIEIWASLAERSVNLAPTPADTAIMQTFGVRLLSPSVLMIACILPFINIFYGIGQMLQRRRIKTPEEIDAERREQLARVRMEGELRAARAEANGNVRAAQVRGAGQAAAAAKAEGLALLGRKQQAQEQATMTPGNDPDLPPPSPPTPPTPPRRDHGWEDEVYDDDLDEEDRYATQSVQPLSRSNGHYKQNGNSLYRGRVPTPTIAETPFNGTRGRKSKVLPASTLQQIRKRTRKTKYEAQGYAALDEDRTLTKNELRRILGCRMKDASEIHDRYFHELREHDWLTEEGIAGNPAITLA